MTKKKDMIKLDGKVYKKEAFIIEDEHPAIGRILIVEGIKFKILDLKQNKFPKQGTFLSKLTERDEEMMQEYDNDLEELSEKLVKKLDIKRLIKENMKNKSYQEIKTGLFILKAEDDGEEIEEEHARGCYNFTMFFQNQEFNFTSGSDYLEPLE